MRRRQEKILTVIAYKITGETKEHFAAAAANEPNNVSQVPFEEFAGSGYVFNYVCLGYELLYVAILTCNYLWVILFVPVHLSRLSS